MKYRPAGSKLTKATKVVTFTVNSYIEPTEPAQIDGPLCTHRPPKASFKCQTEEIKTKKCNFRITHCTSPRNRFESSIMLLLNNSCPVVVNHALGMRADCCTLGANHHSERWWREAGKEATQSGWQSFTHDSVSHTRGTIAHRSNSNRR